MSANGHETDTGIKQVRENGAIKVGVSPSSLTINIIDQ